MLNKLPAQVLASGSDTSVEKTRIRIQHFRDRRSSMGGFALAFVDERLDEELVLETRQVCWHESQCVRQREIRAFELDHITRLDVLLSSKHTCVDI